MTANGPREIPVPAPDWSAAIVAIARASDKTRFAELFSHFAPRLKGFFVRAGMAPAAAEDLAQEAMLAVWRKASYFDPGRASASTWIFTIARNLRIDLHRREQDPGKLFNLYDSVVDPDQVENLAARDLQTRVRAALAQLPKDQADVIRLSFFEDRPHSEIADALRIPMGTVKSRIRLAMGRLKSLVGDVL